MNQVQCIGRLVREVTVTKVGDDKLILHNAIAINHSKRNGTKEVDFIPITVWNKKAQLMADYLQKGDEIGIVGQLRSHHYENKLGQTVHRLEVVVSEITFLRKKQQKELTLDDLLESAAETPA